MALAETAGAARLLLVGDGRSEIQRVLIGPELLERPKL
jgi:hypothetical protein